MGNFFFTNPTTLNILRISTSIVSFYLISGFFCSCTFTTTKEKPASFTITLDSLSKLINGIMPNEEINVRGFENTANGKSSSELTIDLFNPRVFPADSSEVIDFAEQIAVVIKQSLQAHTQYDLFKIQFVHRKNGEAVTKFDYVAKTFKSNDLKNNYAVATLGSSFDSYTSRAIGKTIFNRGDSNIIAAFSYFNITPNLPLSLEIVKETDTARYLFKSIDQGTTEAGSWFYYVKFNADNFYKVKELSSGDYQVNYLVNDTVVRTRSFKLL